MRDITPLFNLPKKVSAGIGNSAAALEQQLRSAQQKAQQEQQRRRELEARLKVHAFAFRSGQGSLDTLKLGQRLLSALIAVCNQTDLL